MPLTVRPFEDRDRPEAARLLARSHRAARIAEPALPALFEDPGPCATAITTVLADGNAEMVVAERDGRLAGFLGGTRSLQAPDSFGAQYAPPHSISVPLAAHAIAEDEPPVETYRALYAPLAERWAEDGFFAHHVTIRAHDAATREAWFLLGFGANATFATRPTAPIEAGVSGGASGVQVHRASVEELPVIGHLDELESLHHRESPIFWPHLGRDVARSVEAFQRAALEGTENPIFIATRDGRPLAMHFVMRSGFGGRLSTPDGSLYLYQAIVEPEARGGGVGTLLLQHTLDWARGEGFEWVNLHYAAMNPSGAPFWQHHGFTPLEISIERTLDERIAWAKKR